MRSSASRRCARRSSSMRPSRRGDRGVAPLRRITQRRAREERRGRRRPALESARPAGAGRTIVDRIETAYALDREYARLATRRPRPARPAAGTDLDALVFAARESLREEDRPDPFAGDARGFRRWVRGRVARARVIEDEGRVVFVGYADVQRPEGWLLQGIYTWPEVRGRGFATAGVSDLCREAFAAGADHVQLAVVEGNVPGVRSTRDSASSPSRGSAPSSSPRVDAETRPFGSMRVVSFQRTRRNRPWVCWTARWRS